LHGAGDREFGPYASSQADIASTAGLPVACLRLVCDWRDIDERESVPSPSVAAAIDRSDGQAALFISASAPDSTFQACIDQFEIKDGNRLCNSGSAANEQ